MKPKSSQEGFKELSLPEATKHIEDDGQNEDQGKEIPKNSYKRWSQKDTELYIIYSLKVVCLCEKPDISFLKRRRYLRFDRDFTDFLISKNNAYKDLNSP